MGDINWWQILISFVAGQLALAIFPIARRWLGGFWGGVFFFVPAVRRFLRLKRFAASNEEFWALAKSSKKASDYNIPPMITFANFKGGVGKTTVAANIIASMSKAHGLKVLVFDLDYQGSLTSVLCRGIQDENRKNLLELWITESDAKNGSFSNFVHNAQASLPGVCVATSDYNIANVEERELIRWLINPSKKDDVRYRLIENLKRFHEEVQEFDLIIADAPPRLSLSSVNGLVATSQVVVPTEPTDLATRPIGQMLRRLMMLRDMVCGKFRVSAIIFNKTHNLRTLTGDEKAKQKLANDTIADALSALSECQRNAQGELPKMLAPNIRFAPKIARPDPETIAYLLEDEQKVRTAFDDLAEQLLGMLGVASKR
ncbi:MAG: ParA family protein [Pseudomonadota bacterium]